MFYRFALMIAWRHRHDIMRVLRQVHGIVTPRLAQRG